MAIVELLTSRRSTIGDEPSCELVFHITGTMDDAVARATLIASIPTNYYGLPLIDADVECVNWKIWKGTARYSYQKKDEEGDDTFSFEIGSKQLHFDYSLETISKTAPAGGSTESYYNAINVTGNGADKQVQGVDLDLDSAYKFSRRKIFSAATVTSTYRATLFNLCYLPKYNDAAWYGFAAGEVICVSVSGSTRKDGTWELTFNYAARPNETNIDVGGEITVPSKLGWHYLWVRWGNYAATNLVLPKPIQANVERVFDSADFTLFGIGA